METLEYEFDQEYLVSDFMFENAFRKEEENRIRNRIRELIMPAGKEYTYEEIIKLGGVMFHDESVLNIAWKHVDHFRQDDVCVYNIALWIYDHFHHLKALSWIGSGEQLSGILGDAINKACDVK